MMKRYILGMVLSLLTLTLAVAQEKNQFNPVYTGVNSLDIAPDSRGGGMGDVAISRHIRQNITFRIRQKCNISVKILFINRFN